MTIELRKIAITNSQTEETICFRADIYVNGTKAGFARNAGKGGATGYYPHEGKCALIKEAEAYCLTLPPRHIPNGENSFDVPMSLEVFIDKIIGKLFDEKELAKLNQKIAKACRKGLTYGVPSTGSFMTFSWKNHTLEEVLKTSAGKALVINAIRKIKSELKPGEVIFNTNIPQDILNA